MSLGSKAFVEAIRPIQKEEIKEIKNNNMTILMSLMLKMMKRRRKMVTMMRWHG